MIKPRIAVLCALLISGASALAQANGQQSAGEQRIQEILNGYRSDGTMALPKMTLAEVKIAVDAKFKYPIKSAQPIISPPAGAAYKDFTIVSKIRIYAGSSIRVKGHSAHPYIQVRESFVASPVELVKRIEPKTDLERQDIQRRNTGNPALDGFYEEMGAFPHRAFGTSPGESTYIDVRDGTYQVVYLVTQIRSYEVYDGINWPDRAFAKKYSDAFLDASYRRKWLRGWNQIGQYPSPEEAEQIAQLFGSRRTPSSIFEAYPSLGIYEVAVNTVVRNSKIVGMCGTHACSIFEYARGLGIPALLVPEEVNPIGKVFETTTGFGNDHVSCWLWENGAWRVNQYPWGQNSMTKRGTHLLTNGMGATSFWRKDTSQNAEYPLVIEATAEH